MNLALAVDISLSLLICAVVAWVIAVHDSVAAVIGFVAYGLLLGLIWVRLAAPDVALTEAAIGGGLTGALLINAAARLRSSEAAAQAGYPGRVTRILAALLATSIALLVGGAVLTLPTPAPTLAPAVAANLAATAMGNPITGVLLAFRAMDTLLEAIVVLLAMLGVWSLAADQAWAGAPRLRRYPDPDGVLAYLAQILVPIGIVVGFYIFWIGADQPGGKFQGATILAAMWLLALGAGLSKLPAINCRYLRSLLVAGPLLFIALGFYGALTAGGFLAYPDGYAKLLIITIEIALLPTLVLTLVLLVAGAPRQVPNAPTTPP